LFGDRAHHIVFGDMFTCHCELPFSCIQILAVYSALLSSTYSPSYARSDH
jgi:hypothetical protein